MEATIFERPVIVTPDVFNAFCNDELNIVLKEILLVDWCKYLDGEDSAKDSAKEVSSGKSVSWSMFSLGRKSLRYTDHDMMSTEWF